MCQPLPSQPTLPPLILVTNDDGISSPGLLAAVQAAMSLGETLVVAPSRQWSGAGRCMPRVSQWLASPVSLEVGAQQIAATHVNASPAMVVAYAVLRLAPRRPDLVISGVNYGVNLGSDVTSSGTVGAALQGAVAGIPGLAVSLQTGKETHYGPATHVDFCAAIHFTRLFGQRLLRGNLPFDLDILKIDLPLDATPNTPWRLTRCSRQEYFVSQDYDGATSEEPPELDYRAHPDPGRTESDSDIRALAADNLISVTPLSIDLSSRADTAEIEELLRCPATH